MSAPRRFVVAEGGAVAGLRIEAERTLLRGLRLIDGFTAAGPGSACRGTVADEESAGRAVLAALAGADLLITVDGAADGALIDRLCDDLRRLGRLDHRTDEDVTELDSLDDDAVALLGLLARGLTLGEAAARLHLSRRTADRRLAEAKEAIGAHSTAEAVAALRGS